MNGYCSLHDLEYFLLESDDVCPVCLKAKEQDLKWRAEDSANE